MAESRAYRCRSILVLGLVLAPLAGGWAQSGSEDQRDAFGEAYSAYQAALDAGDSASLAAAAKRAYELGQAYFGPSNANTAALALNYGNALIRSGADAGAAVDVLREAERIYEALHGPSSLDLAEVNLALADAQPRYEDRHAAVTGALEIYRAAAPDDRAGYAQVLFSGAAALTAARPGSLEAEPLLEEALEILEEELGDKSPSLIPVLIELGNLGMNRSPPAAAFPDHYRRAARIARSSDALDDAAVADVELRIGLQLGRTEPTATIRYLGSARRAFERLLGAEHPKTALATIALAEAHFAVREMKPARDHAERALEIYANGQEDAANLFRTRRLLMAIHLHEGDEDLFDEQLTAAGALPARFTNSQDQVPILKYAPIYPELAARARAEGYVVVEFTVDETGRVRDPHVVESYSEKGQGEWFHEAALDAAKKFRYIPRYADGEPVSTPRVRNKLTFVMGE